MGNDTNEHRTRRGNGRSPNGASRNAWGGKGTREGSARLSLVPDLGDAVDRVLAAGGAIIIARTSDGGAVALTLLTDGGREKTYAAEQAELNDAFSALAVAFLVS